IRPRLSSCGPSDKREDCPSPGAAKQRRSSSAPPEGPHDDAADLDSPQPPGAPIDQPGINLRYAQPATLVMPDNPHETCEFHPTACPSPSHPHSAASENVIPAN